MSVARITRVAFLSAALYIAKIALEFLPNVELVSFLIIVFTLVFGKEVLLVITVFNMFQLLQWGFGTWWITYLYAWPILCLIVLLLKRFFGEEFILWAMIAGAYGLVFGGMFAIVYIPIDPAYALAYWISGLPWDVWHGAANFVIVLVIGKPVYKALKTIKSKMYV